MISGTLLLKVLTKHDSRLFGLAQGEPQAWHVAQHPARTKFSSLVLRRTSTFTVHLHHIWLPRFAVH